MQDFNQYGTRRGNHEVMMRGTFANIRIKNQMVRDETGNVVEGGYAIHQPSGERMFIYDAAMRYQSEGVPLVVFAGKEYGTGSSRDWAAKGTNLLGVRAVMAESFERIHRSNLVGMGVVPLVFEGETSWASLGLKGDETVTILGLADDLKPRQRMEMQITSADGTETRVPLICRIDTLDELEYFRNGGILHYVLRSSSDEPRSRSIRVGPSAARRASPHAAGRSPRPGSPTRLRHLPPALASLRPRLLCAFRLLPFASWPFTFRLAAFWPVHRRRRFCLNGHAFPGRPLIPR